MKKFSKATQGLQKTDVRKYVSFCDLKMAKALFKRTETFTEQRSTFVESFSVMFRDGCEKAHIAFWLIIC